MKVGLIAMSGTRICDPYLLASLPDCAGPLARLQAVASLPSLALLTVAAVIRREDNVQVEYLQCRSLSEWAELPEGFDLVGISSYTAQIEEAYELADRFKSEGVPVVIGGTHVSVLPEETTARGHIAAVGEAELVWPLIIRDFKHGLLKKTYGKLGEVCDLHESPVPAFDLLDPSVFNRIPIQTSRGCPHRCEFCAASVVYSPRHRQKTIEQVLSEIRTVLSVWKRPFIEFVDDNALVDRAYWKKLLSELRKHRLRWFAECDISIGQDQELLQIMRESGCREVLIGLESPLADDLNGLELKCNWKARVHARYRDSLKAIQDHHIRVIGCFMLGLDEQHADAGELIYEFAREVELFDVQVTLQTAFPGTPLFFRLAAEERLPLPVDYKHCTLFDLNIVPKGNRSDMVIDDFRRLLAKIHSNEESAWRWRKFKERMRKKSPLSSGVPG